MFDTVLSFFLGDPPVDEISLVIYTVFKYGIAFYLFDKVFGLLFDLPSKILK